MRRTRPLFKEMAKSEESVERSKVKKMCKALLKSKKKEATLDQMISQFCKGNNRMKYSHFQKFMESILAEKEEVNVINYPCVVFDEYSNLQNEVSNIDLRRSQNKAKK